MTTENKPEVHIISITGNPVSQHFLKMIKPSWVDRGFDVHHFEAITPETLPSYLKFSDKKRRKVPFHPTEKAVWYSHAALWAYARDQKKPIIVVEHDIELLVDRIPEKVYNNDIVCLSWTYKDDKNDNRKHKLAGGAYYITPEAAGRILLNAKKMLIDTNSDGLIHHHCSQFGSWDYFKLCQQKRDKEIGNTITHNK